MKSHASSLLVLVLACLLPLPSKGQGKAYIFTSFYYPGASQTNALGVNNDGQIVGNEESHGFSYRDGYFTTIDYPNVHQTNPVGINNAGQVVGWYLANDLNLSNHAFLYTNGSFTTIDNPNEVFTNAYGINDAGQVVGTYYDGVIQHGYLYNEGQFITIDYPNTPLRTTVLQGINNTGRIVGFYYDNLNNSHGFLYSAGSFTSIEVPNSLHYVYALGINNVGQVAGYYQDANGHYRGFVDKDGSFTIVDCPNAGNTFVYGINDLGQISGTCATNNVGVYGFLATPDTTPPIISGLPTHGCTIWPPDHKLVQVATVTAADPDSGIAPGSFTVTGTSNDPPNGQIVISGDANGFNVLLGADKGQVYTITATATDLAGNTATVTSTCTVPDDQGN